jgi:hypothetical protein
MWLPWSYGTTWDKKTRLVQIGHHHEKPREIGHGHGETMRIHANLGEFGHSKLCMH